MVKTVINNTVGLEQFPSTNGLVVDNAATLNGATTLNGALTVAGAGLEATKFSDELTIAVGQANYDTNVTLPAGALLIDLGYIVTTTIDADTGSTVTVQFGTAAATADIIASKQVNEDNTDVAAGVVQSVLAANFATAGTPTPPNTFATFEPAVTLHSATAQTIHMRVTIGGADLAGAGAVRMFARYAIVA